MLTQGTPMVLNPFSKMMKFDFITGTPGSNPCPIIMEDSGHKLKKISLQKKPYSVCET
jgi:hypothetical protein